MSTVIKYQLNLASEAGIAEHLSSCDANFIPLLSSRVDINNYAKKIADKATRFEAWSDGTLIGLVAAYCNDNEKRIAYITNVSVLKEWAGQGIATILMNRCIKHVRAVGIRQICLEVASDNTPAIRLYEKSGFVGESANLAFITMNLYF